jgi:hypothetical protein
MCCHCAMVQQRWLVSGQLDGNGHRHAATTAVMTTSRNAHDTRARPDCHAAYLHHAASDRKSRRHGPLMARATRT